MPVIDISAEVRTLGGLSALAAGRVTVSYWSAPGVPAATVDGGRVSFSGGVEVPIVDGAPTVPVLVPATDARCYATVRINPESPSTAAGRYQSGPVAIPSTDVALADLVPVDPATFAPTPVTPTLAETIDDRIDEYLAINPPGVPTVVDNGDGTLTITSAVIDNGDGTITIGAPA